MKKSRGARASPDSSTARVNTTYTPLVSFLSFTSPHLLNMRTRAFRRPPRTRTKPRTDTNTTPRPPRVDARAPHNRARAHHARLHASRVARARRAARRTTRDAREDAPTTRGGVADDPRQGRQRSGDDHEWAVEETTRGDRGHDVVRGGRTERTAEGPGHELATARLAAESGVAGFLGSGARARGGEGTRARDGLSARGRSRAFERDATRDARGEVEARARWAREWMEACARAKTR